MSFTEINFSIERIENIFVIRIDGAINSFTKNRFTEEVKNYNKKGAIILDMEEVILVSSSGISALKEINEFSYSSGNKIILLNPSLQIKQVFEMGGIKNLFGVAANEELAMKMASRTSRRI